MKLPMDVAPASDDVMCWPPTQESVNKRHNDRIDKLLEQVKIEYVWIEEGIKNVS